jgi:decaprenylphospho-beta-D-ribofuranose 2-oxidase
MSPASGAGPERTLLLGWGRTAPSSATVIRPADGSEAEVAMARPLPGRAVGFRGLGRSYGDAAQSAGGTVIETTSMTRILELDTTTGVVRSEAGVSIDALLRRIVPLGWFVPVTPGTRMVTLGGAVAADVHGKNHHRDGSIGQHVIALTLVTPDATVHHLTPGDMLFAATLGGMGLTGLITEVTLRLLPVRSAYLQVETTRAPDLDTLMATLSTHDGRHRYSVAWIDCLSTGQALGRGIVTSGDHVGPESLTGRAAEAASVFSPEVRLRAPTSAPPGLLNRASVRAFNEVWFRRAPTRTSTDIEHAATFFHPLDGVADWNRIYGPRGFVQYQYVVPFGSEDVVTRSIRLLADAGAASFLAVLKRFGAEGDGLLSFPMPGWTLALDLPVRRGLPGLLAALDRLVLAAGGRLYLAKDSRMPRSLLEAGYPRLEAFRAVRRGLDPECRIATDLSRRLDL